MSFLDRALTVGSDIYKNHRRLHRNAEELYTETLRLNSLSEDLFNRAKNEARRNRGAISNQLSGWLKRVENFLRDIDRFKISYENLGFFRLIPRNSLVNDVMDLLQRVARLIDEGNSLSARGQLWQEPEPDPFPTVPAEISSASLVGAEEPLRKVKDCIMNQDIGIIGIYGMGGVGKTTLLNIINNEFLSGETCRGIFDVAIWVTVSREAKDIPSIQKTIAGRLGLPSNPAAAKDTLFAELSKRRFVLFLDDVWEQQNLLEELGIPRPNTLNHTCKILFTTRFEKVCCDMNADVLVKVGCLDEDSSWELFRSEFAKKDSNHHVLDDDPAIKQLAKQVVKKCGGLPLSLITVGRAIAAKAKTADDWRGAITKLDERPEELWEGMKDKVLPSLKFSYEMLSTTLQSCLQYFALFPEDNYIEQKQIVDYWICEGFLDSEDYVENDIEDTRQKGYELITDLKNACLLEGHGEGRHNGRWYERPVSIHDSILDLVLWITGRDFVVLSGSKCTTFKLHVWQNAKRISLIENRQVKKPPSSRWDLDCGNLTTLLLQESRLAKKIPRDKDFFTRMPALKVLDLSWGELSDLPNGITSLTSLRYLSLAGNNLTSLPGTLGNLVNLRQLILSCNENLQRIPREALSGLTSLQVLDMSDCDPHTDLEFLQRSELDDLLTLESLSELHLRRCDCSWELLRVISKSEVLRRSIRELHVFDACPSPPTGDIISKQICKLSKRLTSLELSGKLDKPVKGQLELHSDRLQYVRALTIRHFIEAKISIIGDRVAPLFSSLMILEIAYCGCDELGWIDGLPLLSFLWVRHCEKLVEIVPDGSGSSNDQTPTFFPKLTRMELEYLPSLRSIGTRTFPSLKELKLNNCSQLRQLPSMFPSLGRLNVRDCEELTEILPDGSSSEDQTISLFFPKLESIWLTNLPLLRSISRHKLLLPCLETLTVSGCPQLRRLPFGTDSIPNIRDIKGTITWWNGLEWDNERLRESLGSCFRKIDEEET